MIPSAKEVAAKAARNTPEFKRLCEYFTQEANKGQASFSFYISPSFRNAREQFLLLLREQGYRVETINSDNIKVTAL